ncbi:replication-relaxation family protein [Microbacterium sp. NPDC076895]|uniref:replication-relaxation family protein n=1 Tax=Microbacterium sp. NPDC076895 TaxID=3154957 RepID=UPI00342196FB
MVTAVRHLDLEEHLTERDVRILEDLERFRLLTTRQLQRLHFPAAPLGPHVTVSGATRGTTRVLNRLEARGAIARLARRIGGIKHGSAVTIWQLGPAGERYLRARRGEPRRRRYDEPGLTFVAHTLAVADIAVSLLEQAHAHRFELLELELEPASWRSFNGSGASVITLKPDLLVVTADAATETHSFIEVDRATEHLPAVLRKCYTYQRHQRTGIEQQTRKLYPAIVWIVPGIDRAQKIREAIAADRGLAPGLFTIITGEQTLATLAPYGPSSPFTPKGGIT